MKFIEAQILAVQGQILYRHAEIVSGAYKFRPIQQGVAPVPGLTSEGTHWRDLTDEEKLQDSMGILKAQVHRLHELSEALYDEQNPKTELDGRDVEDEYA